MRTLALSLSLGALTLVGCMSAQSDDAYRAYYTTPLPPGAVVLPMPPTHAAARPPASSMPAYLPD